MLQELASYLRKITHRKKNVFFRNFGPPHFCTVFPTICGTVVKKKKTKNNGPGCSGLGFLGPPGPIWGSGSPKFLVRGWETEQQGFTTCCLLSVSVESAMECQVTCLMTCFSRCVFERYYVKSQRSLFKKKKTGLRRQRKPLACGPKHCRFSRTSHGCLPTSCDTRGVESACNSAELAGAGYWTSCTLSYCSMGQQKSRRWWALRHERAPHYSQGQTDERHGWHAERCETKHVRKTWRTHQPPHHVVAQYWATPRRRDLLAWSLAWTCAPWRNAPLQTHHVVVRMPENTWDLEGNVACGVWICLRVGDVRRCAMWGKPSVDPALVIHKSIPKKNEPRMPKTQRKKGSKFRAPMLAAHPVFIDGTCTER